MGGEGCDQEGQRMNFGEALAACKQGQRIARKGWNGKGLFVYYVPANRYAAQTQVAKDYFGERVPYRDYLVMKTVDEDAVPWVASQSDLLCDDWQVVT